MPRDNEMTRHYKFLLDGVEIRIPVGTELYVHFQEQFHPSGGTDAQRKRSTTLRNLVRAAYQAGVEDGRRQPRH